MLFGPKFHFGFSKYFFQRFCVSVISKPNMEFEPTSPRVTFFTHWASQGLLSFAFSHTKILTRNVFRLLLPTFIFKFWITLFWTHPCMQAENLVLYCDLIENNNFFERNKCIPCINMKDMTGYGYFFIRFYVFC